MKKYTAPLHHITDKHGVVHFSCRIPGVELFYKGQRVEVRIGKKTVSQFTAVLDTGASNTYVAQGIIVALKMKASRKDVVRTGNAKVTSGVYDQTSVRLPGNLGQFDLQIRSTPNFKAVLDEDYQLLIGMDILSKGKLIVDGKAGVFMLEF